MSDANYNVARVAFLYPAVSFAFGGLLIGAVSPSCHLSRLRNKGIELIATLSFGIYLVQKMVFHWNESHLPMIGVSPYSDTGFAMTLATCVFVATVLHLLVERPFMLLRERLDLT
jgi:peptidoglycan/LPS O-acetylase OafA/YrhL